MTTTKTPDPAAVRSSKYEEGYKAVLVREETKERLRDLRLSLSDRDLNLERRLATAAIEMVIDDATVDPSVKARLEKAVRGVVARDWTTKDKRISAAA